MLADGELTSCLLYDGKRQTTLRGELPYEAEGLHWKIATDSVRRAWGNEGVQAIGFVDREEVARGFVTDIRGDDRVAILHVAPPEEHEH